MKKCTYIETHVQLTRSNSKGNNKIKSRLYHVQERVIIISVRF